MYENVARRWQVIHRQPFGKRLLKEMNSAYHCDKGRFFKRSKPLPNPQRGRLLSLLACTINVYILGKPLD
jgi:hypothetical protein